VAGLLKPWGARDPISGTVQGPDMGDRGCGGTVQASCYWARCNEPSAVNGCPHTWHKMAPGLPSRRSPGSAGGGVHERCRLSGSRPLLRAVTGSHVRLARSMVVILAR
jgi:hypothetical protein